MALTDQSSLRIVLYEGSGSTALAAEERFATLTNLLDRGFAVTRASGQGAVAPADRTSLLVLGRFDNGRAPQADSGTDGTRVQFRDISSLDSNGINEAVEQAREGAGAFKHGEWKPWFPVIDYDRCTNCMQCLSFCLFGVYGADGDGHIQVQNNDNCKTNCPACSRVCPEAAIMFPKYKAGPINGDIVRESDMQKEKMKVDISSLLGGDVYSMLRHRSDDAKARFSKERDDKKALAERQKCLTKLAQAGDIPIEVMMSLPSPDEILRRAGEAKAKAAAALAAQAKN